MPRVTITVPEKNAQPYRFQLDRQVVTLGRGSENDIAIESGSVSVKHAEMRRIEGGYEIVDVGSTNGIKIDGVRQDVIPLRSGATVKLGDVAFDFVLSDEEAEALAKEKPAVVESPIIQEPEIVPARITSTPKPLPPTIAPPPTVVTAGSGGIGFGSILLFLILAAAAFFAGLSLRHQKETGKSLIETLQDRFAEKRIIQVTVPAPAGQKPEK
jgi:pSer/pThr/pTyr-binding forkhead associated (FHA) protein